MLIGIAAKNGVLIVEFAGHLRDRGNELIDAIVKASVTRLRPVLMTSLCTVFGALPLKDRKFYRVVEARGTESGR